MGHSQADKAASRERVLAAASSQIRSEGLESISVGKLMADAGLTHGGFYGHFDSRADLLAQALERALVDGEASATLAASTSNQPGRFARFVRGYLSRSHRDAPERGCAIAALVCDAGRADVACRDAMAAHIEAYIAFVARNLNGDEAGAIAAVSTMVGALALSRVLSANGRSDAILRAAREHVVAMETASA